MFSFAVNKPYCFGVNLLGEIYFNNREVGSDPNLMCTERETLVVCTIHHLQNLFCNGRWSIYGGLTGHHSTAHSGDATLSIVMVTEFCEFCDDGRIQNSDLPCQLFWQRLEALASLLDMRTVVWREENSIEEPDRAERQVELAFEISGMLEDEVASTRDRLDKELQHYWDLSGMAVV